MSIDTTQPAPQIQLSAPRKARVRWHPAWMILGMAAATMFLSAPGQSFSVAAFVDPMLAELPVLRTDYSTAYLVGTLVSGLALPFFGRFLDAYGARRALPLVALLLGGACVFMGNVYHAITLYVGFSLIRCLGQGSLTLISNWMVGEWFERRRGLATGLAGLGGTLSVMTIPLLNEALIGGFGWRNAWIVLAVIVWVVLVLPGLILVRDRPEDMGLAPDWRRTASNPPSHDEQPDQLGATQTTEQSWTVSEVIRTPTFWKLLSVIATCSLVGTGLIFHQVSLLGEHGVSRFDTLRLLGLHALVATVTSIVAGYLTDRMQARYLLAVSMLFLTLALALLFVMPSPGYALLYSCLLGMQGGIIRSTGMVVWINYYGRRFQGAVRGFAMAVMVTAAAFGPLPLALAKDYLGGYDIALGCFLVLPALAAACVLTAAPPQKPASIGIILGKAGAKND